ncbi:MAG: hypothetical protein AB8H03_16270 [Saprospiraceae bacterium]
MMENKLHLKKTTWFTFILLTLFFTSCEVESSNVQQQSFFDINDFLKKEMTQLSEVRSIKKKVEINGKIDEQILEKFDLEKDLTIFRNSNINKIAWLDKYDVDSTTNNSGQLIELKYQATDPKLKTQQLIIFYKEEKVNSIFIKNTSGNQVSELQQNLRYNSMKGYSVESNQKVTLSEEQKLKVEVIFLNN